MAEENKDGQDRRFELITGLLIAVFAAVLALSDLAGGKYGDDQLVAGNEKTSAYMWYQAKSIKETIVEGERNLLKVLIDSGSIVSDKTSELNRHIEGLDKNLARYEKEKNEILKGSSKVGKENWAVRVDNELGNVTGAIEWGEKAEALDDAGNFFDLAGLFLQLSLVLGAISLIIQSRTPQRVFFTLMVVLGITGSIIAAYAYSMASAI